MPFALCHPDGIPLPLLLPSVIIIACDAMRYDCCFVLNSGWMQSKQVIPDDGLLEMMAFTDENTDDVVRNIFKLAVDQILLG